MEKYHIGKFIEDAPGHKGWFVGVFMDDARKTDVMEIKYCQGEIDNHKKKVSSTYECTIVVAGSMEGEIDGNPISLKAGDYVAIPPGVSNNLSVKTSDDLRVFTIKAPSDPKAKKVIEE